MKRLLLALILAATATAAYAACRTYTFTTSDGRMVMCTECCYYGNCTVNCF